MYHSFRRVAVGPISHLLCAMLVLCCPLVGTAQLGPLQPAQLLGQWQLVANEIKGSKVSLDPERYREVYAFSEGGTYTRNVTYEGAKTSEKGQWNIQQPKELHLDNRESVSHPFSTLFNLKMRVERADRDQLILSVPEGLERTYYFYDRLP